jgi:hypothetical protein
MEQNLSGNIACDIGCAKYDMFARWKTISDIGDN